jgi:RNA polymerase sigma-70 factor, ECF subfamily
MLKISFPLAKGTDVDRKREQFLIQAAKRGDSQAFTELYDTHVDRIFHYIYARISIKNIAEELTGDVFVAVLEGLPKYEDRGTPILAWMYRIAHDHVADYYRHSRKADIHEDFDLLEAGSEDNIDDSLISAYQVKTVQEAMRRLTSEQQQVIMLRFIEGHSLEATAELLGKKVGAVKSLQFRAVQALSQILQELKRSMDEK